MTPRRPIRVLILDDSATTRQLCAEHLALDPDFDIVGPLADPAVAQRRLRGEYFDVLLLDIEMSGAGVALVEQLLRERSLPLVVFSTLSGPRATLGTAALAAGASAIVRKPQTQLATALKSTAQTLLSTLRRVIRAPLAPAPADAAGDGSGSAVRRERRRSPDELPPLQVRGKMNADSMLPDPSGLRPPVGGAPLIAIGASTGGTQALESVLIALPADAARRLPGIVIVQHMPEKFTTMYAKRLDELCPLDVREAVDGDKVRSGLALLAPGGRHMMVKRDGNGYRVEVVDGPLVNRHKPSVDLLFRSVALAAGASAFGVILTGMGDDGARGMKEMHDAGACTVAQDEASCVVFGMPKVAIEMGGVDKIVPLDRIHQEMLACGSP